MSLDGILIVVNHTTNPNAWKILLPDDLNALRPGTTTSDTELTWVVQQIHAAGLAARVQVQVQDDLNGTQPPTNTDTVNEFMAAYQTYMTNRAAFYQSIGVDAMSLDCIGWTLYTGYESLYASLMIPVGQAVRNVFAGKLWVDLYPRNLADSRLNSYVDFYVAIPYIENPSINGK